MADAYCFSNSKQRTMAEIKNRMQYLFQKIPELNQYAHPSMSLKPSPNECKENMELIEIGRNIDSSLQSIIDSRRRLFKKFAGDLFVLPKTFLANATLPFWPHTPQSSSANQNQQHKSSKKKASSILLANLPSPNPIKHNLMSAGRRSSFSITQPSNAENANAASPHKKSMSSAISNIKSSALKDKMLSGTSSTSTGTYIRSQRLKAIKVGIVKSIEKQLSERGIGNFSYLFYSISRNETINANSGDLCSSR